MIEKPIVNSLSGGKTSSYMAKYYPADLNVFALVRIEAEYAKPKDSSIVKFVSDKIGMEFIATAESDLTLYAMRDLEQLLGKEIIWVTGVTFDELIRKRKALPNQAWRFCTDQLKMYPIVDYCYNHYPQGVTMRLGIRHDEDTRVDYDNVVYKIKNGIHEKSGRNKWIKVRWRDLEYPLVDDMITNFHVVKWAKETGLVFPKSSNCVGCFWKAKQELRINFDVEPVKMRWFKEQEELLGRTWKSRTKYKNIEKIGIQQDFFYGMEGSGCKSGWCKA
jgi:hypothetical protein